MRIEERTGPSSHVGVNGMQSRNDICPEGEGIVIVFVKRHPADFPVGLASPHGQERRLPESRRGGNKRELAVHTLVQAVMQSVAGNNAWAGTRDEEFAL